MDIFGRRKKFEENVMQTLSSVSNRMSLARKVNIDVRDEDLDKALQYPDKVTPQMLREMWRRHAFARAIVDKPVKDTWKGGVELKGAMSEEFRTLNKKLGLSDKLKRLDRLAQFGTYAVLVLGFDDGKWNTVVGKGAELKYVRPVGQPNVSISTYETNKKDYRYGLPRMYKVEIGNEDITVHYSRIIHVAYDMLDDEVEGNPKMVAVYNRLIDLKKLLGGDAEIYWRNARPGYFAKAEEGYSLGDGVGEKFKEQLDEYENNLRRFLISEGIDVKNLEQPIADPRNHVWVQFAGISAVYDIAIRILIGAEQGDLASSQDKRRWNEAIAARRSNDIDYKILYPFIEQLQELGTLKEGDFETLWQDPFTISDKDKAEVAKSKVDALAAYLNNPLGQDVIPIEAFLRYFMEFGEEEIEAILSMQEGNVSKMLKEQNEIDDLPQD